MAKFEEEKVINALHPEKAEVGKKYYFSDRLLKLKKNVEENYTDCVDILEEVKDLKGTPPFNISSCRWELLYPYEEPPKQRMTNRQFVEWCSKGNGQWKWRDTSQCHVDYSYSETTDNKEVDENIHIRLWGSEEWIEPTVDIYERDCKGGKK